MVIKFNLVNQFHFGNSKSATKERVFITHHDGSTNLPLRPVLNIHEKNLLHRQEGGGLSATTAADYR